MNIAAGKTVVPSSGMYFPMKTAESRETDKTGTGSPALNDGAESNATNNIACNLNTIARGLNIIARNLNTIVRHLSIIARNLCIISEQSLTILFEHVLTILLEQSLTILLVLLSLIIFVRAESNHRICKIFSMNSLQPLFVPFYTFFPFNTLTLSSSFASRENQVSLISLSA